MEKILLVDGMSLLFRAYYAMPVSMVSSDGTSTGALYGFMRLLLSAVEKENPDKIFVCLDRKEKTFRHELCDAYKANRTSPPDELAEQIILLPEILDNIGITSISSPGYEADDVIATVAKIEEKRGNMSVVVTGDKDILQIISDKTSVLINKRANQDDIKYTPEVFKDEYELSLEQYVWYKALKGDSSDNYSGIPGIGDKTARKIIDESKDIDELKNHPKIAKHIDEFEKSLKLARICSGAVIDEKKLEESSTFIPEKAIPVFMDYGFSSLVKRFRADKKSSFKEENIEISEIPKEIDGDFALYIAPDEVSFSDGESVKKVEIGTGIFASNEKAIDAFSNVLKSDNTKILMDLKSTLKYVDVSEPTFDIGIAAHIDNSSFKSFDIATLKSHYLEDDIPNPLAMIEIKKKLESNLAEKKQLDLLNEVEKPLTRVLDRVEKRGIKIDKSSLDSLGKDFESKLCVLAENIFEIAGTDFNILSPKQLSHILFEKMGIKPIKKTKSGYSTSAEVLEKLRPLTPIIDHVLEYRELSKLLNTYIKPLPTFADSDDRIHTTFLQNGTATGRLSSANPNLQNIPIRTEWGTHIREAFISKEGYSIISADYSQIELRVLAHLSGDGDLIKAFKSGQDIHTYTACKMFNVEKPTSEQRRQAKIINFGILYGMSSHRLSNEFGISFAEAKKFIDDYFGRFKGIKKYTSSVVENAIEDGYTETILGRRRYVPELSSKNFQVKAVGERIAVNSPIQGSSADIIKLAMLDVEKNLEGTGAAQILQIHDELLIECPDEKVEDISKIVKETMESVIELDVPLLVDTGWGKNWLVAK
ncbi:MAG: DNA polymerase I [Caldisericia bacterium]